MAGFSIPGLPVFNFPDVVGLLTQDAVSLAAGFLRAPWGIYFGVIPIVAADNVVSFDFDQQFQIVDYPLEGGQFESFNKVYKPFDVTIRFTRGGSLIQRQELLDSIRAVIADTNLYNVVTEDAVYTDVNLVGYRYQQTAAKGVGLMQVDVMARQVKSAVAAVPVNVISSPIDPTASPQVNGGPVQPVLPNKSATVQIGNITGSASAPNG